MILLNFGRPSTIDSKDFLLNTKRCADLLLTQADSVLKHRLLANAISPKYCPYKLIQSFLQWRPFVFSMARIRPISRKYISDPISPYSYTSSPCLKIDSVSYRTRVKSWYSERPKKRGHFMMKGLWISKRSFLLSFLFICLKTSSD